MTTDHSGDNGGLDKKSPKKEKNLKSNRPITLDISAKDKQKSKQLKPKPTEYKQAQVIMAKQTENMTLGRKTFMEGFNLKTEVEKLLKKNGISYKRIVHHIEDPYEKRRYKKEFVGQRLWIYQKDNSSAALRHIRIPGILVRQTDLIDEPEEWLEEYLQTALD